MTARGFALLFLAMSIMPAALGAEQLASTDSQPSRVCRGPCSDRPESSVAAAADHPMVTAWVTIEPVNQDDAIAAKRPGLLIGMYAGSGLLQAYDTYSTLAGVKANKVELNPLMSEMVKNPPVFIAAKSAMTLVTIFAAEQLWRQGHPGKAIALMAVSNALMAAIAARNASVLHTR